MVLNIAHRGGAGLKPENTLGAFAHALKLGADGAELDVQLTRDGQAIVTHDFLLADGRAICDCYYSALKAFGMPLLDEVIEAVSGDPNFLLLIEIKSSLHTPPQSRPGIEIAEEVLRVVEARNFKDRVIYVGFDWPSLTHIVKQQLDAVCWFSTPENFATDDPVALADGIAASGGAGLFAHYASTTGDLIKAAHDSGLMYGIWTLNDAASMRALAKGVDAICTDYPDRLLQAASI